MIVIDSIHSSLTAIQHFNGAHAGKHQLAWEENISIFRNNRNIAKNHEVATATTDLPCNLKKKLS